jgi:DNA-directed RNA polymerase subunit RPC12/RpoP
MMTEQQRPFFDPTKAIGASTSEPKRRKQAGPKVVSSGRRKYICQSCEETFHLDRWFAPGETVRCPICGCDKSPIKRIRN